MTEKYSVSVNITEHTTNPLKLYMAEMLEYRQLSALEEVMLAKRIERGKVAQIRLQATDELEEDEKVALEYDKEDGAIATQAFITANLPLVVSVAQLYAKPGVDKLDLIQEGNLGLIDAVQAFDYHRGNKFSTFAIRRIKKKVHSFLAYQAKPIEIPRDIYEQINVEAQVRNALFEQLGREPTNAEVARNMKFTRSKKNREKFVQQVQRASSATVPLRRFMAEATSEEEDVDVPSTDTAVDEVVFQNLLHAEIIGILKLLPPRQRRIIELRFGLYDGKYYTLAETGNELGLSRERIRQIEKELMLKIYDESRRRHLDAYID